MDPGILVLVAICALPMLGLGGALGIRVMRDLAAIAAEVASEIEASVRGRAGPYR